MRPTIGDLLEFVNACPPARRWAKKLGNRAFKKAWMSCPKAGWLEYLVYHLIDSPTEEDRRMYRRLCTSIEEYVRDNGLTYTDKVPGRVVRSVVPWKYVKKLLRKFEREVDKRWPLD